MDLNTYQELAGRTRNTKLDPEKRRLVAALGLVSEGGEVGEVVKKEIAHGHAEDREKVAKELGDVFWYAAELASAYNLKLGDIAEGNIAKLKARYPEGFNEAHSIHRANEDI